MDLAWIGHGSFRLRGRDAAVVTDPCPSSTGFRLNRPRAEIVTVSNAAPEFSWVEGVAGEPFQLDAPGEYEVKNVLIASIRTPLARKGAEGHNLAFVITVDDIVIVHLGDLGALPPTDQIEELSQADVALVPVGGARASGRRRGSSGDQQARAEVSSPHAVQGRARDRAARHD